MRRLVDLFFAGLFAVSSVILLAFLVFFFATHQWIGVVLLGLMELCGATILLTLRWAERHTPDT